MDIAADLRPVAEHAARIVGAGAPPGVFIVVIRGVVGAASVTDLGWEWFWHAPADLVPGPAAISLGTSPDGAGGGGSTRRPGTTHDG